MSSNFNNSLIVGAYCYMPITGRGFAMIGQVYLKNLVQKNTPDGETVTGTLFFSEHPHQGVAAQMSLRN